MTEAPLQFLAATLFLAGIVTVLASAVPRFERRAGALLGGGFLLAVAAVALAVVAAILAG